MLKNRLNSKISTGTLQICSITQQNDAEGVKVFHRSSVCVYMLHAIFITEGFSDPSALSTLCAESGRTALKE